MQRKNFVEKGVINNCIKFVRYSNIVVHNYYDNA